jgi:hypothetical protein
MNGGWLRALIVDVVAAGVRRWFVQMLLVGMGCGGVPGLPIMNAETLGVAQGCDRSHLWC